MVRRPNKSILAHTMTLRTRYEDHIEFFGREAEESNSDRAGRRRTMEVQRAMYIQELKERVASGEYAVGASFGRAPSWQLAASSADSFHAKW